MLDCISVDRVGVLSETKTATVGLMQVTLAMPEKCYSADQLHTWVKANEHVWLLINTSVHIHKYV